MGGMEFRKLRVTWSVAWGVVAALLARVANSEFYGIHGVPIYSPKWLLVPLPLVLGSLAWFRLQFSLGRLFVIVTLVAM